MKAAVIDAAGPTESINSIEMDEPQVGDSQVLIRNHAVAMNPVDTYIQNGAVALELPSQFAAGDRVWCTIQGLLGHQRTFAEKIAVVADVCTRFPIRLTSNGQFRSNISTTLRLSEAAQTHRLQESATLQCDGKASNKMVQTA